MTNAIMEYIQNSKIIIHNRLKKKPFYDELVKMQHDAKYEDLIEFCYFLKTNKVGRCQYKDCENKTAFISFKKGYRLGCCEDHTKRINNLAKYGVENVMQDKKIQEKQQAKMIEKYGSIHALQNSEILEKMKRTQIDNGGIGAANVKTRQKMKETNLERIGFENPMQDPSIRDKFNTTMFKRYGTIHALQNNDLNQKRIETNLERFGAEHHMQSESYKSKLRYNFIRTKMDKISSRVTPLFDLDSYMGIEQKLRWKCNICNTEFIDDLDNGKIPRCLNCFPLINTGYSKAEQELVNELKKDFEVITNDRTILSGKEIDILIPEKKIAIEFNGIYWHSELNGKDKNYHLDKTAKCTEKGIQLIHIFETEWLEKRDIVLSVLHAKLGKFKKRIYARKCKIKEIDKKDKKVFLEENHLQGNDRSSIMLGLYYVDELVSVMTFGKPRDNKNYEYEIFRFANKNGYQIIGGASKLFKNFIKMYNPESIITYSDKRYSNGIFYEKIGFTKLKDSQPAYWYFKNASKLMNRKGWQKHLLEKKLEIFNPDLTEWENMQLNGYNRIWDCGNYVFGWHKQ